MPIQHRSELSPSPAEPAPSPTEPASCASSEFAVALLVALVEGGVRHVVVSPGSRSQALALAAAELEQAGIIELHVRIDERDAGFFALGIGMASGHSAAVITTSGSAVAHLLPSVMEASRTGIPMVLLTADRPAALRDTGANQTTHQSGIFDPFTVDSSDTSPDVYEANPVAAAAKLAGRILGSGTGTSELVANGAPGPVHANIQFVEPLSGPHSSIDHIQHELQAYAADGATASSAHPPIRQVDSASTVVIAGFRSNPAVAEAATYAGVPVVAEVTSGSRAWHSVPNYRDWLAAGADGRNTLVVSGLPNLSREVWAIASRPDVQLITVTQPGSEAFSPGHRAELTSGVTFHGGDGGSQVSTSSGSAATPGSDAPADVASTSTATPSSPSFSGPEGSIGRDDVVDLVWGSSTGGDAIYIAASNMVRVADKRVGASPVPVYSHRGLAGIDGTIAAAIGVARVAESVQPGCLIRLIIGDLAFAHDVGGLLLPTGEEFPNLQIVVVNDHGGSIFDGLEVAASEPTLYERVVRTPCDLNVANVAAAYGWEYTLAQRPSELWARLADRRPTIIEIPMATV
ncbi:2-succinyl-5-enolpyruvyl-6-hydroxy-3-cyclohexene-1-carboxylic-acid synthase [Changpingibacter yushuensis]|uniref:2-succinyl-5-enolpyruvyl-6-hydroxy-3- cyclohexene-1-carboxylic-acid synthase n=1 Tax=Changpingibacter yushuensis TaxID=2758440 RepID=UPI0015F3B5E7|nr:2-succinyl-5-enolpyruvyl-6-hydroxy-3-cyclohexene-1-carboxylic-acid synthase [Changpingibacter yushuensis]